VAALEQEAIALPEAASEAKCGVGVDVTLVQSHPVFEGVLVVGDRGESAVSAEYI
jgi:hypothetical protein